MKHTMHDKGYPFQRKISCDYNTTIDRIDALSADLVANSVHLVCCLQCQQSGLLNLNTGLCNIRQDGALFGKRLTKHHSPLNL